MEALEIAQLVLRVVLGLGFLLLGLSHPVLRSRKALIEGVIPTRWIGRAEGDHASRRMLRIGNAMLVASAVGGLALLVPLEGVRIAGAALLATMVLALAASHAESIRRHWREPAIRSELVGIVGANVAIALALVAAVL